MRKLAEVCSIKTVETIIYKDQEYTKVRKYTLNENAYEFVAQTGFNEGDKVIFIGEGALIPASNKNFEFLRAKCYSQKSDSFRIKPVKMCGLISMGILMPMNILNQDYSIGTDLTETLQIKKYEDEEDATPSGRRKVFKEIMYRYLPFIAKLIWNKGDGKEEFPSWLISKTDETNIQNMTEQLKKYSDRPCYVSLKMEGQSGTFILDKSGKFYCCSRNYKYGKHCDNNYWKIADDVCIKEKLLMYHKKTGKHLAIQGEICGPGIQNNIYRLKKLCLFVFNVKDIDANEYLSYDEFISFCNDYGFDTVPVIFTYDGVKQFVTPETMKETEDNMVEKLCFSFDKDGQLNLFEKMDTKIDNKNVFHHEGIVLRTTDMSFSCKFKSKEYALWYSGKAE